MQLWVPRYLWDSGAWALGGNGVCSFSPLPSSPRNLEKSAQSSRLARGEPTLLPPFFLLGFYELWPCCVHMHVGVSTCVHGCVCTVVKYVYRSVLCLPVSVCVHLWCVCVHGGSMCVCARLWCAWLSVCTQLGVVVAYLCAWVGACTWLCFVCVRMG